MSKSVRGEKHEGDPNPQERNPVTDTTKIIRDDSTSTNHATSQEGEPVAPQSGGGEVKWCPTMSGRMHAYEPEYRRTHGKDQEWQRVPVERANKVTGTGQHYPLIGGGVMETVCLYGRAQAWALGWGYAASAEAQGVELEIRLAQYEVHYDIKARKLEVALTAE